MDKWMTHPAPATARHWLRRSRTELDAIFSTATPGAVPQGEFDGLLIVWVTGFARPVAAITRALVWHGKVFAPNRVLNRVTPFGFCTVPGRVYLDDSRLDGKLSFVIDYSKTSFVARHVRDEIREVQPGLYLGKVWWRNLRVCDFALSRR
jgi:hypothetical protein